MASLKRANICLIVDENNPRTLLQSNLSNHFQGHYVLIKSKCDLNNSITDFEDNIFHISTNYKSIILMFVLLGHTAGLINTLYILTVNLLLVNIRIFQINIILKIFIAKKLW